MLAKLGELITIYYENLYHTQKLQTQIHNKSVKPKSYALDNKIWLNTKYLKTKQNRKLKVKFFGSFWVIYPVGKEVYKLKLLKKWRIHNVFHMLLLEQDIIKKKRVDNKVTKLDFKASNSKEYKVEAIRDSAVYTKELRDYLSGFYYLIA